MEAPEDAVGNGSGSLAEYRPGASSELEALRATCRRRAYLIDVLEKEIVSLHEWANDLEAENARLRADGAASANGRGRDARLIEVRLPLDMNAPAAARAAVVGHLRERASGYALENAQLVASELMTNSVRHSGAATSEAVVLRIKVSGSTVHLEVEDPGCEGAIALRAPDRQGSGGGFGLELVQTLSERWGMERDAVRGTRVWADLALAA